MERQEYIHELMIKFAAGTCTEQELQNLLNHFRENEDNPDIIIPDYNKIEHLFPEESLGEEASRRIFLEIKKNIKHKQKRLRLKKYYRVAALIALLLSVGIVLRVLLNKPDLEAFDPHSEHITLVNEKGEVQIIDPEAVKIINTTAGTADQNRTTMVFSGSSDDTKLVYNTIRVPYGKTFRIVLSDGTAVDLNAGTSVTFPVNFIESEPNRNVTMVGEAFFDVTKDVKHPFVVHTDEMDVKVLGTAFNVSNYPESKTSDVVLVRGAVTLTGKYDKESSIFNSVNLSPGEKGSFHKENRQMEKQKVISGIYTAWIKGELVFRDTSFENILIMLERKFNVKIINHNKEIAKEVFDASFKEDKIEVILNYFKSTYGITYIRDKNNIIIN